MSYAERPEDLKQDTKNFLLSEYGQYIMQILKDKSQGELVNVTNINETHVDRYAQRYAVIKEIVELIQQPLDDDTSPRG